MKKSTLEKRIEKGHFRGVALEVLKELAGIKNYYRIKADGKIRRLYGKRPVYLEVRLLGQDYQCPQRLQAKVRIRQRCPAWWCQRKVYHSEDEVNRLIEERYNNGSKTDSGSVLNPKGGRGGGESLRVFPLRKRESIRTKEQDLHRRRPR